MPDAFSNAFSSVGLGGSVIIGATIVSLVMAVGAHLFLGARYASLERDLIGNPRADHPFSQAVLNRILREAEQARAGSPEVSSQAIIEHCFQSELGPLLVAERFVRSATGLVIILGLLGTFYGLTLSIGRLIGLVSGDAGMAADVTAVVTKGLTQSLSGMSVAFTNSLFGITAAVVLTVLGVFHNVTDRRTAVMVQIETYLDRVLAARPVAMVHGAASAALDGVTVNPVPETLTLIVADFGKSVERLESTILRFDAALQSFAASTRDFKEFNLHLKDNVQRMSLSFGDFSETLRNQIGALKSADRS